MAIGLPQGSLEVWFARVLRDAFALEVSGDFRPFREVASGALRVLLEQHSVATTSQNIEQVLSAFAQLPAHDDVEPAFRLLRDAGIPIALLTNGSNETTRKMIENAGLADYVAHYFSIDDVKHWKPRREAYLHAANALNVAPEELALVAAHDWDTHGAGAAGLISAGVLRKPFSNAFHSLDITGDTLVEVVEKLLMGKDAH